MKILRRLLLWTTISILAVFILLTVYVKFYGKAGILQALNTSLKTTVTIEDIYYHVPFGVSAYKITVGDYFQADAVSVQINPKSFFQRHIILSDVLLVKPEVIIKKELKVQEPAPIENVPQTAGAQGGVAPVSQPSSVVSDDKNLSKDQRPKVYIDQLIVKDGQVSYNNNAPRDTFQFQLENVQLRAQQLTCPFSNEQTQFSLIGRLAEDQSPLAGSSVQSSGWFNMVEKNMQAQLKVEDPGKKGGLTANIVAKNNHATVSGELNLNNFLSKFRKKEDSGASSVDDIVTSVLSSMEIGAKFSFETKMDDFQVNNIAFSGSVSTNSISDMLPAAGSTK